MKPTQLDAVAAWALAALKGTAQQKPLRAKLDKQKPPALFSHFKLDALERRILELAWAVERSFAVAEAARARGGLTVERVRELLDDAAVDAALSLKRTLRRHALVAVGAGGAIAATDLVRLAPGLAARLDGNGEADALWPGLQRLVPGARGDVPQRVAVVLDELDARAATILTLDGCARREAYELAAGLARRSGRGVLLVDGELAATAPSPWQLLSCARREAELDGDALFVSQSAALGEHWRALLTAPAGALVPFVVLADALQTRDPLPAPWLVRRLSLHPPTAAATAAPAAVEMALEKPPVIDDGLEHVRQMAIRDAERALGIFRPPPAARPVAPPPSAPKPAAATPAQPQAQPAPAPAPAPQARPQPPSTDKAPARSDEIPDELRRGQLPTDREAARAVMMQRRAAAKREKEEKEAQARRAAAQQTASQPAPDPAPAAATSPPEATPPAPAAAPGPVAAPIADGTPLPLPAEPSLDELVRACSTSPSSAQRIDIIGRLKGVKNGAVVAALRANAGSAHPGVRAAAEAAMALLFGPNWNVSRPVPKPVQPPPTDDKDRGPPGGW